MHHWIQTDITLTAKLLACSSGHHWCVQTSNSQQRITDILQHHRNGIGVTSNIHLGTSRKHFTTSSSSHPDYLKDIHCHFDIIPLCINTYCHSDWATDIESRKSTSGRVTSVLGVPLAFNSRAQSTVATSSAEAELYAIGLGISDSLHIYQLLQELQQYLQRQTFDFDNIQTQHNLNNSFSTSPSLTTTNHQFTSSPTAHQRSASATSSASTSGRSTSC